MDIEWCKSCDKGLPAPDVIIYLDLPVEVSALRGNFGEERYENALFQNKVRSKFMSLKNDDEEKNENTWHVVDATRSIDEIQEDVKCVAEKTIEMVAGTKIEKLWV